MRTQRRFPSRVISYLCFLPLLVNASIGGQNEVTFDPYHQAPLTYEKGDLIVTATAVGTRRELSVSANRGAPQVILLPVTFAQIDKLIEGPPGSLVVVGRSGAYVWEIGVVSVRPLALEDAFTCFSPSVSPNADYVAFTKFFPPHFVQGPEDHNMLYFTSHSAQRNRPPGIMPADPVDVGLPVYPPGIGNSR